MNTKDILAKNLTGNKNLSKDQIENINYELLWYLVSDYFKPNEIQSNGMTKKEYMIKKFPSEFTKYVKDNPEIADNYLIKRLLTESKKVNNTEFDQITFKNIGSLTDIDRSNISKAWLDLYESDKHTKFAEKLIMYNMMAYGFHITPKSFGYLSPVDYFARLNEDGLSFNDKLLELQETTDTGLYTQFINQFLRNNWKNEFYVPSIDIENIKDGKLDETIKLSKKVHAKALDNGLEGAMFITIKDKEDKTLYRLDEETSKDSKDYTYVKDTPLGIKNISKEYAFEEPLTSVFASNLPKVKKTTKKITRI